MEKHLLDAALEQVWKRRRAKRLSLNRTAQPQRRFYWCQNQPPRFRRGHHIQDHGYQQFRRERKTSPVLSEHTPRCKSEDSQAEPPYQDSNTHSLVFTPSEAEGQSQAEASAGTMTPCNTTEEDGVHIVYADPPASLDPVEEDVKEEEFEEDQVALREPSAPMDMDLCSPTPPSSPASKGQPQDSLMALNTQLAEAKQELHEIQSIPDDQEQLCMWLDEKLAEKHIEALDTKIQQVHQEKSVTPMGIPTPPYFSPELTGGWTKQDFKPVEYDTLEQTIHEEKEELLKLQVSALGKNTESTW